MKRKLIGYEVFNKMKENSISAAVKELVGAEDHLARALNLDGLKLASYTDSNVIYESTAGTYLRANYSLEDGKINFEDVEELVIDEESEKVQTRSHIANMLEAILDDDTPKAQAAFDQYMDLASTRYRREAVDHAELTESERPTVRAYGSAERTKGGKPVISVNRGSKDSNMARDASAATKRKRAATRKKHSSQNKTNLKKLKRLHPVLKNKSGGKHYSGTREKKHMREWQELAHNVFEYCSYTENNHVQPEVKETGDRVTVSIPNAKSRNEGKMLKMTYNNMLKTDCKVLREAARHLNNDQKFCMAVAEIKRYNNISDNENLEESIGRLVGMFPSVLYLTEDELSQVVAHALDSAGVTNYDDETCKFMAEGILRVAHGTYVDRVDRIMKLANKEIQEGSEDAYLDFQAIVKDFFGKIDESIELEMKMFEDLYNASVDIRRVAMESENEVVRTEASDFISELEDVLNGRQMPSLELAADVANWLEDLVEANIPGSSETWDVVKKPYQTQTGDHPQMAKNAKVPAVSGAYTGDWGDPAPMIGQDSNAWNHGDEARYRSWGNKGKYPDITNPYAPKPFGDYTMKGEKGVDKETESGLGMWQDSDTFPVLKNPYVPSAVMPVQKVQPDNKVEP